MRVLVDIDLGSKGLSSDPDVLSHQVETIFTQLGNDIGYRISVTQLFEQLHMDILGGSYELKVGEYLVLTGKKAKDRRRFLWQR
jgi:hypothetical protein